MSPEILELLAPSAPALWRLAAGTLGSVAALGGALIGVPLLAPRLLPPANETRLPDFIPFSKLLSDRRTIQCRNGTLVRIYELAGADLGSASVGKRDAYRAARKQWLDRMSDADVELRCFLVRNRVAAKPRTLPENPLLAEIVGAHGAGLGDLYENRQYMMMSTPRSSSAISILDQAGDLLAATLADYSPAVLTDNPSRPDIGPLAFLARLISPVTRPTPTAPTTATTDEPYLGEILAADEAEFTRSSITFSAGPTQIHTAALGIRWLGDNTEEDLVRDISTVPSETVILTTIRPMSQPTSLAVLEHHERLAKVGRLGTGAAEQFIEAKTLVEGLGEDRQRLHRVSQVILLQHTSVELLDIAVREALKIAAQHGVTLVREGIAAEASWFSQFPGFEKHPRSYDLYSSNVAELVTFDKAAAGREDGPWGTGPLAVFRTATGAAHKFHIHVESSSDQPVGHAVCIGPTDSGKTTLFSFLGACAQRYPQVLNFIFDRFNGVEVFTRAIGGSYVTFDGASGSAAMNPLQMKDTADNRAFLKQWLLAITACDDETSIAETSRAIDSAFKYMAREQRSLSAIYKAGFSANSRMRAELKKWLPGGHYGSLFDAPRDTIDFGTRQVAFDFTRVLDDPVLAPAVVSYLMHRIRTTLEETGSAGFIMIDETEPMLRNDYFRVHMAKPMLQEFRKINSAILLCFQRPGAIDELGMGDVVRGQCQTVFFFRNYQAERKDYEGWNLTEQDWDFVRGVRARHLERAVLVKRPTMGESVILDTNLTPLGPRLRLLSSSREKVELYRRLAATPGIDVVDSYINWKD